MTELNQPMCFLIAVGTMADDQRNQMWDHLETHGFRWVDASGTRVVFDIDKSMTNINNRRLKNKPIFETSNQLFDHFTKIANKFAKKNKLNITMCLHIEDPGLGIILPGEF